MFTGDLFQAADGGCGQGIGRLGRVRCVRR
jgi:hypothetical protein